MFAWRRRYLAEQQAEAVQLVPVAILNEASSGLCHVADRVTRYGRRLRCLRKRRTELG
ncbi:hypothetical protein ACFQI9_41175 [Paraburkholderia dipogonis]|uniref:hypothetical protein n=1 Tax=Paraburkholderia dipogonis TaxID=1211383 RepID=UPI00361D529F